MDRKLQFRTLTLLGLAAVVAFILVRVSGRQPVAKISATRPVRQNIIATINSNGKVEPISPYSVRAQLDTFVDNVFAHEGQYVKKGLLLIELNVKDAAAQLAAAQARLLRAQDDLRSAEAGGRIDEAARVSGDLTKAQAERDRLLRNQDSLARLQAQGAATKEESEANALALAKAQSEVTRLTAAKEEFLRQVHLDSARFRLSVKQAQSDVAALEDKVRQGRITAPIDGTLYALPIKRGDYVKVGDLLAEMANLHRVRVRAFIDEPDLGGLMPGLAVRITWDALPNVSWQGWTDTPPRQVVPHQSRSVGELLCSVDNDKLQLLPNINVNVRIRSNERVNVITVPRGAVQTEGAKRYVYAVKIGVGNSTLEKREIQVGIADATNFEVLSGLQGGEVVALPGDVELKNGLVVKVVSMDTSNVRDASDEGL